MRTACLVVDAEPCVRGMLTDILAHEGFDVTEADTAEGALASMTQQPRPLVFLGLRLPGVSGCELLRQLKQTWPHVAAIVVSTNGEPTTVSTCLQLGAADFLHKPFHPEDLRIRVRRALEHRALGLEVEMYRLALEDRVRIESQRNEQLFLGTVQALAQALEAKDPYLQGHSARVASYASAVARYLNLKEVDTVILGGQLHDIGKIGVMESILHKPDKLTAAEYAHIMAHSDTGARILHPVLRDHPDVIRIVRHHHERLDGRGFPDGLKGDKIPVCARIVAVADAFDAMTTGRAYRAAMSVDHAFEEMHTHSGTQWDPDIVQGFFGAFPDPHALPLTLNPGRERNA